MFEKARKDSVALEDLPDTEERVDFFQIIIYKCIYENSVQDSEKTKKKCPKRVRKAPKKV